MSRNQREGRYLGWRRLHPSEKHGRYGHMRVGKSGFACLRDWTYFINEIVGSNSQDFY